MENAVNIKNGILTAMAAVGAFISNQLGGWDAAMQVLVTMMAADYLTGLLVAAFWHKSNKSKSGALDSKACFKGICKKCMILLLVWLGVLLDNALSVAYIRMTVIFFFMGNEGLSLLENIGLMGMPYPKKLKDILEALKEKGDKGEEAKEA